MDRLKVKQLIDSYVIGLKSKPLAILTSSAEIQDELRNYLESLDGAKRINNLLIASASQYFDAKGCLVSDIKQKRQRLADGRAYSVTEYLNNRVAEYDTPSVKFLYDYSYCTTPAMLGVSRYISEKVGRKLIVIAPVPFRNQEKLFDSFEVIVCE